MTSFDFPCARAVEIWPLDRPRPHPRNPRTHSVEQLAFLAASVKRHKLVRPLIVDEAGVILAGHGLFEALRLIGVEQVPVLVLDHLSDDEKQTFLIADNQLSAASGWDEEELSLLLAELEKKSVDLTELGFTTQELDRLLADLAPEQGGIEEDELPPKSRRIVSVTGDLWVLGGNRVLCGDATSEEALQSLLGGQTAAMVFSDPPYNVNYRPHRGARQVGSGQIVNDDLGPQFEAFLYRACVQLLAVSRGAVYLCMSSSELHTLQKAFTAAGGHWSTFLIWVKSAFTLGRSDYQRQYEAILYGWKEGQEHYWCGARNEGDVWFVAKPKKNRLHPTMKPVSLIERAIRNSSQRGEVVLDPFGGSGSTAIACEKSGRRAAVVELEPEYVDVIVERWQAYTNRSAHREGDGKSYTEVAQERLQERGVKE